MGISKWTRDFDTIMDFFSSCGHPAMDFKLAEIFQIFQVWNIKQEDILRDSNCLGNYSSTLSCIKFAAPYMKIGHFGSCPRNCRQGDMPN